MKNFKKHIISNMIVLQGKPIPKRKWEQYIINKTRTKTAKEIFDALENGIIDNLNTLNEPEPSRAYRRLKLRYGL